VKDTFNKRYAQRSRQYRNSVWSRWRHQETRHWRRRECSRRSRRSNRECGATVPLHSPLRVCGAS